MAKLPENNLSYPVLIRIGKGSGTGFYVNTGPKLFLVTAAHVLFDLKTRKPRGPKVLLQSSPGEGKDNSVLEIDMKQMTKHGLFDGHGDVGVIHLGDRAKDGKIKFHPGVRYVEGVKNPLVSVPLAGIRTYADVGLTNEIFLLGYPLSLGLAHSPQIDWNRPLLRNGVVAGKYEARKTIILDCPAYGGNSGGPVIELDEEVRDGKIRKLFRVIGVVIEFVPYVTGRGMPPMNSGYAVAASMDRVLELIARFK